MEMIVQSMKVKKSSNKLDNVPLNGRPTCAHTQCDIPTGTERVHESHGAGRSILHGLFWRIDVKFIAAQRRRHLLTTQSGPRVCSTVVQAANKKLAELVKLTLAVLWTHDFLRTKSGYDRHG
ncbi:unnamed protein product [Ixodes persulcatus]